MIYVLLYMEDIEKKKKIDKKKPQQKNNDRGIVKGK
jgi:hypothetical protein